MRAPESGFNLIELLLYLAVFTLISFLAAPSFFNMVSGLRVELAADEMAAVLHRARFDAVRFNANVAIKFRTEEGGTVTYGLYRDGDGDGVLTEDIESGDDPQMRAPQPLGHFGQRIRFGFPDGPAPRAPGSRRRLDRLHDPIRFNRSDLASFSRRGTATPGTIYLTDGLRHLAAVRVNNHTGKITILHYDRDSETWR